MSTEVVAPAPAPSPKSKKPKSPKKAKIGGAAKTPASHPTYGDMIRRAITDLKDKKGSSRAAILKYILQHFKVGGNIIAVNAHIRQALKRGVTSGALKQVKGIGASGSFRIGEKTVKAKTSKPKKSGVKKPKTKAAAGTKKPKSPKKKSASKKTKSPKKAASPKKAKAAKPKTAKKPAAKKASPKKKTATKKAAKPAPTPAVSA